MEDKNDWITQGIKISCKHKRNLCAVTKSNNDSKAKAHYTKYCKIIIKVIKETRKQHYCKLIEKSNNKIKKTWNIIKKETGKIHSVEQFPTLLVNDEKLQDQTYAAKAFNNFFITMNIHQIEKGVLSKF
jgi:hypothetical protein